MSFPTENKAFLLTFHGQPNRAARSGRLGITFLPERGEERGVVRVAD